MGDCSECGFYGSQDSGGKSIECQVYAEFYKILNFSVHAVTLVRERFPNCTVTGPIDEAWSKIGDQVFIDNMNCNFTCFDPFIQ